MRRLFPLKAWLIRYILPVGFFLLFLSPVSTNATEISIGTIIDTVGMVNDHTTIGLDTGSSVNGSSITYHDSSMTNGGALKMTKMVESGGSDAESETVTAQKVLNYDTAGSGGHLSASERAISRSAVSSGSGQSPVCIFASGDSGNSNQSQSASASLDIVSATSLQLSTSSRISPGDLRYSVSANTSLTSGNHSGQATVASSFSYGSETEGDKNRVSDRSMVSGMFDLFNRVYHAGNGATIQAQTQGSGMVSSKTVSEHTFEQANRTTSSEEWSGSSVYSADILTNGGVLDETRVLSADSELSSQRVVNYHANGSQGMQTEEKVVAVKRISSGTDISSAPVCVLAGGDSNSSGISSYQSVIASSQLFGVDSAQSSSTAHIDIGDQRNGTMPLVVDYKADIASPIQFDAVIVQVMSDPDHDGRFEDLNGNGRRDIQDLVLLFRNFEWLSKSSISPRFDYNNNGRVDLADLTRAFRDIRG